MKGAPREFLDILIQHREQDFFVPYREAEELDTELKRVEFDSQLDLQQDEHCADRSFNLRK